MLFWKILIYVEGFINRVLRCFGIREYDSIFNEGFEYYEVIICE